MKQQCGIQGSNIISVGVSAGVKHMNTCQNSVNLDAKNHFEMLDLQGNQLSSLNWPLSIFTGAALTERDTVQVILVVKTM